jgi:uncharacterized protein
MPTASSVRSAGAGRYKPFLEVDVAKGEVLWELWIDGFAAAVELRPDSWSDLAARGGQAAEALAGMTTLIEIARDESDLPRDRIDALTEAAPDLIPLGVEKLYAARPADAVRPVPANVAKAGRNDPCPCGSGKKHKRCCGRE